MTNEGHDPRNHHGRLVTAEVKRRADERTALLERNKEASRLFALWAQKQASQMQNIYGNPNYAPGYGGGLLGALGMRF